VRAPTPIAFYVSGHGFGHASRDVQIINALRARVRDLPIIVCSTIPAWLLEHSLTTPVELRALECDTGLQQLDSLHADEAASVRRAAAFHEQLAARAAREAEFLARRRVCLVLGDIPPLAFESAAAAGLESIAIGNFTWDWIYEGYPNELGGCPGLLPAIRRAYARTSLALRLPMHGGFAGLERVVRDIPFVTRRSRRSPTEIRRAMKLPAGPLLLISFGGYGIAGLDTRALEQLSDCTLVVTDDGTARGALPSSNLIRVTDAHFHETGCRYEDLVRAVDIVVTKPGYGIVSECIANETAMLYTERGRFAEYDVLIAEIPRYLRSEFIDRDALLAGRWAPHVERLLASPPPPEHPRLDGAEVAAEMICERLATLSRT
jgi:hypothetical protein